MGSTPIETLMGAVNEAVQTLRTLPPGKATLVHHNDADGIASGAILKRAFERAGFQVENLPIERVHPLILPRIHTSDRKLIVYADLGGQAAGIIGRHLQEGTLTLILDHHPPFEVSPANLLHINPELIGIDGDVSSSAATLTFLFARTMSPENDDLAHLAMIGSLGDGQTVNGRLVGLNGMLRRSPCPKD